MVGNLPEFPQTRDVPGPGQGGINQGLTRAHTTVTVPLWSGGSTAETQGSIHPQRHMLLSRKVQPSVLSRLAEVLWTFGSMSLPPEALRDLRV